MQYRYVSFRHASIFETPSSDDLGEAEARHGASVVSLWWLSHSTFSAHPFEQATHFNSLDLHLVSLDLHCLSLLVHIRLWVLTDVMAPQSNSKAHLSLINTFLGEVGLISAVSFGMITIIQANTANREARRTNKIAYKSFLFGCHVFTEMAMACW